MLSDIVSAAFLKTKLLLLALFVLMAVFLFKCLIAVNTENSD